MSEVWLNSPHGTARFDPSCGRVSFLRHGAFRTNTLHTAPWVHEPPLAHLAPVERHLAGDFFCAPFGASDQGPIHGWSANSAWAWEPKNEGLHARLLRPVQGAQITKDLAFTEGPALVQTHTIQGGAGTLPVAHHPMVHAQGQTWLSFSPKSHAVTLPEPLEPGSNWLAIGQHCDLADLRTEKGEAASLEAYPNAEAIEDFVILVEAAEDGLGWTAVIREELDDMILILKNCATLPNTMLWISNGGRTAPPWSGRHRRVLGIEDGFPPSALNHLVPDGRRALSLGSIIKTHHAILRLPRPTGWTHVTRIACQEQGLDVYVKGQTEPLKIPFQPRHLDLQPDL